MINLSRYVDVIPLEDSYILFNTINGDILQFEKNMIGKNDNQFFLQNMCMEDIHYLQNREFLVEDTYIRQKIRDIKTGVENETDISISFSETCNLNCTYCYQNKWNKQDELKPGRLEQIVIGYLLKIVPQIEQIDGILNIRYIGGEPMLKREAIIQLSKQIEKINNGRIRIRYYIDTNGILLDSNFIKSFPNLQLHIPLSLPQDHNLLRSNSFQQVFGKLKEYSALIDGEKYSLVIRYNVHKNNIGKFGEFLSLIKKLNITYQVDVERIIDNDCFFNSLSEYEFDKAYCNIIYPLLCENKLQASLLPKVGIHRHCSGSNCLSRKYLSNGQNVLCDGISKDCVKDNQELQPLEERCINCYDFGYCGGHKNCEPYCEGSYKYKEGARYRIITYVKLVSGLQQI